MSGRHRSHRCISRDRQLKESFYSNSSVHESSLSYEETLEDLKRDNFCTQGSTQKMKYVHRNERKRQCLQEEVFENQLRVQRVIADYDKLLRSEIAKTRKLQCEVTNLHIELECVGEKLKSTTSTNTILMEQMAEKENEVNDLQDQLNEAKIEINKLSSEGGFQKKLNQNLEMVIFFQDIDIKKSHFNIYHSRTKSRTRQKQTEFSVGNYDQYFDRIDQPQEAMARVKETETELSKTETERDRAIHDKTELEIKAKRDEKQIRLLEKDIEKTMQHRELHSYDVRLIEVKEKHERRGKRKERQNETNNHEKESLTSLNGIYAKSERQSHHDKNQKDFISQEDVVQEKELKLTDGQISMITLKVQTGQMLQENLDSIHNKDKSVEDLNEIIKEMEERLLDQQNQLKEALSKLKEKEAQLDDMIYGRDREQQTKLDLEKRSRENVEIIKELTSDNNDLKQRIKAFERNIKPRDLELKAVKEQGKAENSIVKEKGNTLIHQDENKHDFSSREDVHEKDLVLSEEQINIIYLKGQIEKRDQMLAALEESLESTQNKLKSEENLNDLIKKMEAKLSEQQTQLKEALSKLRENEAKLDDMKNERDFERQTRLDHEKRLRKNIDKIKSLTSENNDFKQRIQTSERDIKQRDIKLKAFEEKSKADVYTDKETDNIVSRKDNQIAKLENQLQQLFARLKETEAELEETKTRLSKAMGDRLKDNNPNIADLSDENRPVKLAERYSELYDNQWTDAFDFLSKSIDSEQSKIEALLEILQDIMHFCIASASKQMEDLQGMLVFSNTSLDDIPVDVRLQLKNFRKALSKTAMRNLYGSYMSHLKQTSPDTLRRAPEVRPYVQECFEICWLMSIQDPPVVFAPVAKQGSILNTNIYKPYTRSGTHVEYTVWPAMLLHEKGPILAKGIAQGRK